MSVVMTKAGSTINPFLDEIRCIEFLKMKHPHLLHSYMRNLARARRTILHRITSSLIREDVLGLASASYDLRVIGSVFAMNISTITERETLMIRQLQEANLQEGILYKVYPVNEEEYLIIPVKREYAFRRWDIAGDILHIGSGIKKIHHSTELLEILRNKENSKERENNSWTRLIQELENSSTNLALAYAYYEEKTKNIKQQINERSISDTIEFVQYKQNKDPLFFEQLCIEGHHLHPGSKTKMGMLPEDVFRYAAEFEGTPHLKLMALHRKLCDFRFVDDQEPNEFFFQQFPELEVQIKRYFVQNGMILEDFVLIPVHPWQLENMIPHVYKDELKKKELVFIEGIEIPAKATTSFRTVIPIHKNISIKTAVHSQMTSTVRSISSQSANNGAEVSKLISNIMKQEKQLAEIFIPIYEIGGCAFRSKDSLKNRNLSVIYRNNIEDLTNDSEIAVAGTALYAPSPITGKTILIEILERYAATCGIKSQKEAAENFMKEYVKIALPGYITFMVKYGIGLEGHLQNTIPVFQNGKPVKILFRDWGGLRIYRPRLEKQGHSVHFYPGSMTITDDLQEMQNKVFYTVFQNQIGELIHQISKHWFIDEMLLWKIVRKQCDKMFEQLEMNHELKKFVEEDREMLYQKNIDHKALTKMRLTHDSSKYAYVQVPNPLEKA
jgi:D-ornithine---citrate ligase